MITSGRVLIKRDKSRGHEETVVHVEWGLCSDEDIKLLASFYVQDCVARQLRQNETKLPEAVTVNANEYLHREVITERPVNVPESWRSGTDRTPKKQKKSPDIMELLAGLSKEEVRALLS